MLCVVYILRRAGAKLPLEVVKSRPYTGWLQLGNSEKVYVQEALNLFKTHEMKARACECLIGPTLKKLERGGMLFVGSEEIYSSEYRPQAWWVVPGALDDTTSPQ